ncbi:hypothetical protein E2C01_001572 [Portunus trituberculatus]|uniref:Uncharacterized protein n=1 Tax=Portunus trituberculatus TaxID=210409 RepID=A0A5B7CMU5_PORTR|nr:hypothetical protein [Portunus trituberculatus]
MSHCVVRVTYRYARQMPHFSSSGITDGEGSLVSPEDLPPIHQVSIFVILGKATSPFPLCFINMGGVVGQVVLCSDLVLESSTKPGWSSSELINYTTYVYQVAEPRDIHEV